MRAAALEIIEHVREKFSCRDCEAITEAPAPSHPIPRGFAGPNLLAMMLVNKLLLHQPLNRQSKTYAREGVEIDVSTLADRIGACVVALDPIIEAIRIHITSAERIHADDSVLQKHTESCERGRDDLKICVHKLWQR
nr:transposase [Bradyrhizobium yuanmingense]